MVVVETPSRLEQSWARAWSGLAARNPEANGIEPLLQAWSQPQRKYHTLQHLLECIGAFESVRAIVPHPAEVELALWFHDAVYDVMRSDNEARSAALARAALERAGVPAESMQLVEGLILATRHEALPGSLDEQFLVDIDLSILGAEEHRFAEFERQIREEYAFVPGFLFRMKRRAILRKFLQREYIYCTPPFRQELEERARRNLQAVLR